jgi:hypothetical protein
MWRWTVRILVGLCGLLIVAAASGATYQWLATRKDLASAPPPGRLVDAGIPSLAAAPLGPATFDSSRGRLPSNLPITIPSSD